MSCDTQCKTLFIYQASRLPGTKLEICLTKHIMKVKEASCSKFAKLRSESEAWDSANAGKLAIMSTCQGM